VREREPKTKTKSHTKWLGCDLGVTQEKQRCAHSKACPHRRCLPTALHTTPPLRVGVLSLRETYTIPIPIPPKKRPE